MKFIEGGIKITNMGVLDHPDQVALLKEGKIKPEVQIVDSQNRTVEEIAADANSDVYGIRLLQRVAGIVFVDTLPVRVSSEPFPKKGTVFIDGSDSMTANDVAREDHDKVRLIQNLRASERVIKARTGKYHFFSDVGGDRNIRLPKNQK